MESIGIKKIVEQNNYFNQHLQTIRKQLDMIESSVQFNLTYITTKPSILKIHPFRNFELPKNSSIDFARALEERKRAIKVLFVLENFFF